MERANEHSVHVVFSAEYIVTINATCRELLFRNSSAVRTRA